MPNKKFLPSLGFVIVLVSLLSSILFINWVFSPLSYEKAIYAENRGHQLAKEGKSKQASKYFLAAAQMIDDNVTTSRRYRCAGSTSRDKKDKIKYFKLALKYNVNNKNAKNGLQLLLNTKEEN